MAAVTLEQRLHDLARKVRAVDPESPRFVRSAPGRLDVLGGLAAEAGATVAQMALPRRAGVAVSLRTDRRLVIHSDAIMPPVGEGSVDIPVQELCPIDRPAGGVGSAPATSVTRAYAAQLTGESAWAAPFVSAWCILQQTTGNEAARKALAGGATIIVHSDIAIGAGQASSTGIVAATMQALIDAANAAVGKPAIVMELLELAIAVHRAESLLLSASGHVIDAMTCLTAVGGPPPHVLRYSAQPHTLVGQAPLPPDLRIMAIDTGVRYTAAGETLKSLRLAAAMGLKIIETIYRDLGQRHTPLHGYIANVSPLLYRQYFRALLPKRMRGVDFIRTYGAVPEKAGTIDPKTMYRVRTAVDHLIAEHEHAEQFLQAIEELTDPASEVALDNGETEMGRTGRRIAANRRLARALRQQVLHRAGRLVLASHHSYRLRLELSCREADWLVDHLMESGPAKGIYGARITACGGGGTVLVLMNHSSEANDVLLETLRAYPKVTGLQLTIAEAGTKGCSGVVAEG